MTVLFPGIHFMWQNSQLLGWLLQQLFVLGGTDNGFAKIDRPVDDRLFLILFENTRDYGLCRDAVALVVDNHHAQSVQFGGVEVVVGADGQEIIVCSCMRGWVTADVLKNVVKILKNLFFFKFSLS